ncbi:MAG TPA: M14 family metallopeptidase [Acidobacteriota bacterium]|nr:M14 family metallopeptidase [Acidobacteriota bacterium]
MLKILFRCVLLSALVIASAGASSPALPQVQSGIPTPESVLGFRVGDDYELASYDESLAYFMALAETSDRVELRQVGRTSLGLDWYIALISDPKNLTNVEHYREIAQRLAHPERLTDEEGHALAREGKAIVAIDGGLHATETAHGQHTIQLAYDLVTEKEGDISRAILENVVLVLWFSINPDGQNMIVEWYESNLGTEFEVSRMPRLYQKYVGHDNNRDGYGLNMLESRVVSQVMRHWEPQIMYNHHMTSPFPATFWLPPYAEPISPYVHPLINRTNSLIGLAAAVALDERGLIGSTHMGTGYDFWYPGYIDQVHSFHNIVNMFSEGGLHSYASPRYYSVSDFPQDKQDLRQGALHSSIWKGGWWRLRDSVEYMLTASMATLDVAAKYKENVLYNRYQAGRDVIQQYTEGPPFAYFIPQQQRDPVAAVEMLRRLAFQNIEIHQLTESITFEGQNYPAGTWVIPMARANASFPRVLLSVQEYPDLRQYEDGPPDQPYDAAGWTLPYQMEVRVVEAGSPLDDTVLAAMAPVQGEPIAWQDEDGDAAPFDSLPGVGFDTNPIAAGIVPLPGRSTGIGPALTVDPVQNNAFRAINRAWRNGGNVRFVPGTPESAAGASSSGRYVITGLSDAVMNEMVTELALQAERTSASGTEINKPRIGLYRPWAASMDEGWTRWLIEGFDFDFDSIYNTDFKAGRMRDRYDVIVLVDMRARQILDGSQVGTVPPRYAGGIGQVGVRALDEFVSAGGTLVCLNASSMFAVEHLHLPVENVVAELDNQEFFLNASVVELIVDTSHPVMSGMSEEAAAMVGGSPVFTVSEGFEGAVLAKYQEKGSPLLSGYLLGEEHMQGYAAALDVHHGDGHVILLGLRPQWRGQPYGTFRVLFNAALHSAEVAAMTPSNPGFWSPPVKEEPEEKKGEERTAAR